MKKDFYDIVIIGAGPAGLAASHFICGEKSVLILEKNEKPGAKILASGNGRCNITNENAESYDEVSKFLRSIGLVTFVEDEGRVYPYSEEAKSVLEALLMSLGPNVEISTNSEVIGAQKVCNSSFILKLKNGKEISCSKLVIASGGKSYPSLGTTGDSYTFAKNFGHSISPLIPGLTPINVAENIKELDGVRAKARVTLLKNKEAVLSERGEVQFKKDSLSGICIMNLSNFVRKDGDYELSIDLFEGRDLDVEKGMLITALKSKLAKYVEERKIPIHDMRLKVTGLAGWKEAQITCGGVKLSEVSDETYESRIQPGLYIIGEALDYQGMCGGYNMSHAIYTGIKAGKDLK